MEKPGLNFKRFGSVPDFAPSLSLSDDEDEEEEEVEELEDDDDEESSFI